MLLVAPLPKPHRELHKYLCNSPHNLASIYCSAETFATLKDANEVGDVTLRLRHLI